MLTPQRHIQPKDYITAQFLEREVLKHSSLILDKDLEIYDAIIPHPTNQSQQVFLHSIRCGNPKNEYMVLIHGYGGSLVTFYSMLKQLSQNYYVFCMDLLGMGLSSRPNYEPKAAEQVLSEFVEMIEQFRIASKINKPFHLVGHSLGGYFALGYTMKYQANVQSLLCISAVGMRSVSQEEKDAILNRFRSGNIFKRMFFKIGQSMVTSRTTPARMAQKFSWVSKLLINQYVKKQFNSVDPKIKSAFSDYLDKIFQLPESYQGALYDLLEPPSLSAKFPLRELIIERISVPVAFYYGEFDYMDTSAAQFICAKKSNCQFFRISKSTHHPNMQNPEELSNHMLNFIKSNQKNLSEFANY